MENAEAGMKGVSAVVVVDVVWSTGFSSHTIAITIETGDDDDDGSSLWGFYW